MATFQVFEPADGARTQANAERVVLLREKFSIFAFLLTPFWLLRHRLWLAFIVWLVVFIAIMMVGQLLGFGPFAGMAASFFPSLLFGMEAVNLRGRKLLRKGYRDAGVVIAEDYETAELRFFESWKQKHVSAVTTIRDPSASAVPSPVYPETRQAAATAERNVIGMFPTPGQR